MESKKNKEELSTLYHNLFESSRDDIQSGSHAIDIYIDKPIDNRRGLSLIIRPSEEAQNYIEQFTEELKRIDNAQYYQPRADMHITVLSIISCQDNFELHQIEPDRYIEIISESLKGIPNLAIHSKGVTASKEAIMIQGFMANDNLTVLRDRLRTNFRSSSLKQDIDTRYLTKTAHITAVRFREKINKPTEYLEVIKKYKDVDFGESSVSTVDLVYTDWYCRQSKVQLLKRFAW